MSLLSRNQPLGFADRTLKNLQHIKTAASAGADVHLITQLAVSLLGLIVFPHDRDVEEGSEGEEEAEPTARRWGAPVFLCRSCGALHVAQQARCDGCGREGALLALFAVRQKEGTPGYLTSCVACGALGRQRVGLYREPARPVRAVAVSDVHVLTQNMLQYAERRRLLVFADNRQDAAFQAGWMQDHARRYRLRALIHERLLQSTTRSETC